MSFSTGTRSVRRFTDELREAAEPIWAAQHTHPVVRGIGDGTLDPDRFRSYIRQDYLFLIEYGRLLALASARSPGRSLARRAVARYLRDQALPERDRYGVSPRARPQLREEMTNMRLHGLL